MRNVHKWTVLEPMELPLTDKQAAIKMTTKVKKKKVKVFKGRSDNVH